MATRSTTMVGVTSGIAAKKSKTTRTVARHRGRKSASPRTGSPGGAPAPKRARVSARSEGAAAKSHRPAKRKGKKTGRFDEKDQLLQRYFAGVERHSLLTPAEELVMARRYVKTKDPAAKERLINANLRLAAKVAYRYRNTYPDLLDLIQEANIGLIRAVDGYDPERGTRFTTYAAFWMRATVIRFILTHSRNVRIKSHKPGERKGPAREYSIDFPLDSSGEGTGTLGDTLVADGPSPEQVIAWDDLKSKVDVTLDEFSEGLEDRDRFIFQKRFGEPERVSLRALGAEIGVCQERVRQLEHRLVRRARDFLSERGLMEDGVPALDAA